MADAADLKSASLAGSNPAALTTYETVVELWQTHQLEVLARKCMRVRLPPVSLFLSHPGVAEMATQRAQNAWAFAL